MVLYHFNPYDMPCYVAYVLCKSGELLNLLEYIPKMRKTFTLQLILANAMTNGLLICTTYRPTYVTRESNHSGCSCLY